MKTCKDCGTEIQNFYAERCRPCYVKFNIGENASNYKNGCCLKTYRCIDCGKEISLGVIYRNTKRCMSCSRIEQFKDPINHPRWLGGLSRLPYRIEFYKLREEIRDRDNHECQLCHTKEEDLNRKLDVHHIDYNKENNKPENLISLCSKCNLHVNANRMYWIEYFRKIIVKFVVTNY